MLETLDDAAVHRWCGGGLEALRAHQHEIDELNVYPVPDGDTGTNLVLTLASAQQALEALAAEQAPAVPADATPLAQAMRRMARGALLGARGNSGVIVSQILRGMADSLATSVAARGGELARALRSATEAAYAAVARPVEGTVLTVVAAAADGAGRIKSDDLIVVARAAARSAAEALARTPQQLPALARAGVVDAGGRGLVVLLDALVEALSPAATPSAAARTRQPRPTDTPDPEQTPDDRGGRAAGAADRGDRVSRDDRGGRSAGAAAGHLDGRDPVRSGETARRDDCGDRGSPDGQGGRSAGVADSEGPASPDGFGFGFEVQYLLDSEDDAAVDGLRGVLDRLGDSLVVVGSGDGTWNVHVHVPAAAIGPAVEAGVAAGRPHRITVTPLESTRPHEHTAGPSDAASGTAPGTASDSPAADVPAIVPGDSGRRGAVVVAAGDGLAALFEAEGATVVDRNPSTAEMVEAITGTGAGCVVLLPNDANTHAVASTAAREAESTGIRVSVVPTRSPVQALAALAVRDPARAFTDDVIAMAEAAGACRYGEVCTAQRDSLTVAGPCREGDLLGLVDGEVHVIGADLEDVSRRLLDRMLGGGGELATLVLGADAPATLEQTLAGHVLQMWPFVEVQCYAGGQPRYHLLVGVE